MKINLSSLKVRIKKSFAQIHEKFDITLHILLTKMNGKRIVSNIHRNSDLE